MNDRVGASVNGGHEMVMKQQTKSKDPNCYNCRKVGHSQRNSTELAQEEV